VKRVEQTLREQKRSLELLNETGAIVGSTLDLQNLLQAVTDIATELSGANFGAFFYNETDANWRSVSSLLAFREPQEKPF